MGQAEEGNGQISCNILWHSTVCIINSTPQRLADEGEQKGEPINAHKLPETVPSKRKNLYIGRLLLEVTVGRA